MSKIMRIGKVRSWLEHRKIGRIIGMVLRKCGIVHLLHTLQYRKRRRNREFEPFAEFYKTHKEDYDRVFSILEDEISRKTYENVIRFRMTYNMKYINAVNITPQYFLKDILPPCEDEVFVDGGAYIGDTAFSFLRLYQEGKRYRMYLWEPDEKNIYEMKRVLGDKVNYYVKTYAMWNKKEKLNFSNDGTSTSGIRESGEGTEVEADSIDNQHRNERITFIKMDIEGAEIEALIGAKRVIQEQKPKLAICIYHEWEHLYKIPIMIKEMVPEYKIYIRHHTDTSSETVCYATM